MSDLVALDAANETEAAAALGAVAAGPQELEPGTVYTVADGQGRVKLLDTDAYADAPRRPVAARKISDAGSFVAYVNRHKTVGTEVYAHINTSSVIGVRLPPRL